MNLVRIKSHRAHDAVKRITGQIQYHFVFGGHNDYAFIDDEHIDAVLAVKSVGRARMPEGLRKCWGSS